MKFERQCIVLPGTRVRLRDHDPDETGGIKSKEKAAKLLEQSTRRLAGLQQKLYAEGKRALLVVLQAMDAGGKDGTIRNVMSGANPQGCRVTSFKAPTAEELAHDFLWRIHRAVPARGEIGIFNRSHYEDVLIVRVHRLVPKAVWSARYEQINRFEEILALNGVVIRKFFLHISKREQLARLEERLHDPAKNWKFNPQDLDERKRWGQYVKAYDDALTRCSTLHAPWFIIPANRKWVRNVAVSSILVETLEQLDMKFPKPAVDLSRIKLT